jgi:hypothetical protein
MKNASEVSVDDASPALHVFHRGLKVAAASGRPVGGREQSPPNNEYCAQR